MIQHANIDAEGDYLVRMRERIAAERVPYTGMLELTRRCNLGCVHCYCGEQESVRRSRERELSAEQWERLLDEAAEAGCLDLLLTGGEPMLRPDFTRIYAHAKRLGMIVTVFCNGTLISDAVLMAFSDLPPFFVEISLYGATPETHDRITQSPGSHQRALGGVRALLQLGVRVGLKTVLMNLNAHEYGAMERLAEDLGVKWRSDSAVFPCLPNADSGGRPNACGARCGSPESVLDLRVSPRQAAELECGRSSRAAALRKALKETPRPRVKSLYTCGAGLTGFHLDPYGFLQPCLMAAGYRENALELGFREAWARIARIRSVVAPADYECVTCDLLPICSGCPAVFDLENGDPARRSEYICSLARARFDKIRASGYD